MAAANSDMNAAAVPLFEQRHPRVPPELVYIIASFVPSLNDLLPCSLVCRAWAEIVFPRIHKYIKICTYVESQGAFTRVRGQDLLQSAAELSLFMRSCVREVTFQTASQTLLTSNTLTKILHLFPKLKVVIFAEDKEVRLTDLEKAPEPQLETSDNPNLAHPTSTISRPSVFALRLRCTVNALKLVCDTKCHTHRMGTLSGFGSASVASSASILFRFISIFEEIHKLDLLRFDMRQDSSPPDPAFTKELPRILELTGTFCEVAAIRGGHDAASLICQYLDPSVAKLQVSFAMLDFFVRNPERSYPMVTAIQGDFSLSNQRCQIFAKQFPALMTFELMTWIALKCADPSPGSSDEPGYEDPTASFVHALHYAPRSLSHVVLGITLQCRCRIGIGRSAACTNNRLSFDDIVSRLKEMDWGVLRHLLNSKKAIWTTREIYFMVPPPTKIVRKVQDPKVEDDEKDTREIALNGKQLVYALAEVVRSLCGRGVWTRIGATRWWRSI